MAAYVVLDVVVKDAVRYDDYRKRVIATLGNSCRAEAKWKQWKAHASRSAS